MTAMKRKMMTPYEKQINKVYNQQTEVSQRGTKEKVGAVMGQPHYFHNYLAGSKRAPCCRDVSLARFGAICSVNFAVS